MIETISNDSLSVSVNTYRGVLTSFVDKVHDIELMYSGDVPSCWQKQDVVIFPFVARLKDGYYEVDGKRYDMKSHGILAYADFEVREKSADSITLGMRYSDETLAVYPYKFDFSVIRHLDGNTLVTTFRVVNLDDKTIYFGIGGHPALALPYVDKGDSIDTSMNYLDLGDEYDLSALILHEGKYILGKERFGKMSRIPLSKELVEKYPTLMMTDNIPTKFDLVKSDGRRVGFDITGASVLSLWTWPKIGGYYCIEPWCGLPDHMDPPRELKDKDHIVSLERGKTYDFTFKMTAK